MQDSMPVSLTDRWEEVRTLFDAALDRTSDERGAWLDAHCADADLRAEVDALLACDDRPHRVLDLTTIRFDEPRDDCFPPNYQIGAYRIERLSGRGGMGAVYLAERSDASFDRQVAIKVIGQSLGRADALVRFLTERQALAGLDHPNIATLLDGGATPDGRPYFVMEYVAGEPIDAYCQRHGLGLDDRLALFLRVAAAVQHAHEHLVVHRDLKPDNVLVREDGEPKLLDFGIAKIIAPAGELAATTIHTRAMTPRYASPEQIRGSAIGTSSDIYSLGVLLYQMLSGQLPHGGETDSGWQIERAICETEPRRPSDAARAATLAAPWAHRLAGDLDAIVMMALRKEPQRRYRSVDQFAEDVRRYLTRRPVAARADTLGYRTRKFVARNRVATAAAAIAVIALAGGVVMSAWSARVANDQAQRAEAETVRAKRVSEFMKTIIALPNPSWDSPGVGGRHDMTVLDLLKATGDRIDREFGSDPEIAAELHHTLGNTYLARGLFDDAQPHFAAALELRRRVLGAGDPRIAQSLYFFGANQDNLGHADVAEQYYRDAIAIERRLPFADATLLPYILLDSSDKPAVVAVPGGDERVASEALDLFVRHLGPDHTTVAFAKSVLGDIQDRRGNSAGAKRLYEEALAIFRKQSASPQAEASVLQHLAGISTAEGNFVDAERLIREAIDARTSAFGADNSSTLESDLTLARIFLAEGKPAEAARLGERIIAVKRQQRQTGEPRFASALLFAATVAAQDNPSAAEPLIREALHVADGLPAVERCSAGGIREDAANWYVSQHRRGEAGPLLDHALNDIQAACGPENALNRAAQKAVAEFQEGSQPHR